MDLEIFEALKSVGVDDIKAKAVVSSVNNAIDKRYSLHSEKLAAKNDLTSLEANVKASLAETKVEIIKWMVATMIASNALIATLIKLMN